MTKYEVACTRVHYQRLLESLREYWHCCFKLCGDFAMVVYAHHGTLQVGVQEIVLAYSSREHVWCRVVQVKGKGHGEGCARKLWFEACTKWS